MERPLKRIDIAYLVTLIVLIAIDFVWLSLMADRLYRPVISDMLVREFRLAPAVLFYLLCAAGTVFLTIWPALATHSAATAMAHGVVLGFTAYATYVLTNQARLKNWSPTLMIMWGTCLTTVTEASALLIARRTDAPAGLRGNLR